MIRSFISIDVEDKKIIDSIVKLEQEFSNVDARIKFVEPENLHFTIKFLGNVEEEKIPLISSKLEEVIDQKKVSEFDVFLSGVGCFPSMSRINVIWVGVSEGYKKLSEIALGVEESLEKIGFKREKRKFSPHLTIGRVKAVFDRKSLIKKIEELKGIEIGRFKVTSIKLKKSILKPTGPIYETLYKVSFLPSESGN
ncbi:MAG: RNA 2',3'-cyclic phosphodiesterase [Candidatus Asgardarchaeia archaeon]